MCKTTLSLCLLTATSVQGVIVDSIQNLHFDQRQNAKAYRGPDLIDWGLQALGI